MSTHFTQLPLEPQKAEYNFFYNTNKHSEFWDLSPQLMCEEGLKTQTEMLVKLWVKVSLKLPHLFNQHQAGNRLVFATQCLLGTCRPLRASRNSFITSLYFVALVCLATVFRSLLSWSKSSSSPRSATILKQTDTEMFIMLLEQCSWNVQWNMQLLTLHTSALMRWCAGPL